MVWLATVLALTLPQDVPQPAAEPGKPPGGALTGDAPVRDQIVLEGGERIVGEILKQSGNYIEVRIDANTVVGFERSRVTSIARGRASEASASKSRLAPRDDWYLLRDGEGHSVGYLHGLTQVQQDGKIQLTEEWFFAAGKKSIRVTLLEVVDSELEPNSCFYHERVNDQHGRMVTESLRRGEIRGGRLLVETRSLRGWEKQTYPIRATVGFPLLFREKLRQRPNVEVHAANQTVFDAKTGQFRLVVASSVQRRKVEFDNRIQMVREVAIRDGDKLNLEWIDANSRVLRREVNGASLVAVRVSRARALRAAVTGAIPRAESAIAVSTAGRLALWMPNPVWSLDRADVDSVTVKAPLYDASVTLIELDHLADNIRLATATDAVIRWLRLGLGAQLEVTERYDVTIRRLPAVRLALRWQTLRIGQARTFYGTCHVFRSQGRVLALFSAIPRENYQALQADVDRMLHSVQLMAPEIAPVLQGPLAKKSLK